MKNKAAASAALFSFILALINEQTIGTGTDYYTKNMSSLGFTNETIRGVHYENVEYVFNMSDAGRSCPPQFELVHTQSQAFTQLLEPFVLRDLCQRGGACCMRLLPSPDGSSALPTTSYSPFPLINLGRHDLSIKGKTYKNVPYFLNARQVFWHDKICPGNLKHAIMDTEFDLLPKRHACWVSIVYTGGVRPPPGLDQYNVTLRRSHLRWMLDGERVGRIQQEFWGRTRPDSGSWWRNEHEKTEENWEALRMGYTYFKDFKLHSFSKPGSYPPCCMDLSKAEGL